MDGRLIGVLADGQRRRLLTTLIASGLEDGGEVSVPKESVAEQAQETSRVRLYHVHLPKLSDAGIVQWDRESDEITTGPRFDEACRLLRLVSDRQDEAAADA